MTNKLALYLGIIVIAALAVDAVLHGWFYSLFLAKKFVDLIEYLAFWR